MSEIDAIAILRRFNPTDKEYTALTYGKCKDSIDVDYPTLTLQRIADRIALLEKVAVHAQFYLKGLPDADGYELGDALRAAGYEV